VIHSDTLRIILLVAVALVFVVIALRAFFTPERVATELGYKLVGVNGYSELFAVYFGIWLATAALAVFAATRVNEPIFGDLVALLVLAQPFGRLFAAFRHGLPQGALLFMFVVEVLGGVLLLGVRPA
jgi:hypothetical protein